MVNFLFHLILITMQTTTNTCINIFNININPLLKLTIFMLTIFTVGCHEQNRGSSVLSRLLAASLLNIYHDSRTSAIIS